MDGIIAMEGNGPRGGKARPMKVLLFSADPIALDATVCRMIDIDPEFVPTIKLGMQARNGNVEEGRDRAGGRSLGELRRQGVRCQAGAGSSPIPAAKEAASPQRPCPKTVHRCREVHPVRDLREGLPGGSEGRGLARRRQEGPAVVRVRALHPLLLLPGAVSRGRGRAEGSPSEETSRKEKGHERGRVKHLDKDTGTGKRLVDSTVKSQISVCAPPQR